MKSLSPADSRGSFGFAVGGAGDYDGDGRPDFVVGVPAVGSEGRFFIVRADRLLAGGAAVVMAIVPSPAEAPAFGEVMSP